MNTNWISFLRPIVAIVFAAFLPGAAVADDGDVPDFNRDIRPLLSDRCFFCHGPDETHREADLRLDDFDALTADRGDYQVVVPGRPGESALMERITSSDDDVRMPPADSGKSLSADEIDLFERWIAGGAEVRDHWAFVPPVNHPTPQPQRGDWSFHWIDDFILSRLEASHLPPSPDADPVTLMRRLHFDLTGLPPSADTVSAFAEDSSPGHYAEIVDALLASDAAAERLAMYWLDLVRFADTVGYHGDQEHNISPYRDWVIDAFAANMPFDEFTRAQLAGDLLPDSDIDDRIASGYNRLLQTSHEGGVQPKEYLAIYAADRVRNVSSVWMGATVGCAQCHDHKYDPYTSRDFYSLVAFFADLDEDAHFTNGGNSLPTRRDPEIPVLSRREREQLAALEHQLGEVAGQLESSPDEESLTARHQELTKAIKTLNKSARLTMISVAKEPRTIRVLPRGNWLDDSGEIVSPAVPAFLQLSLLPRRREGGRGPDEGAGGDSASLHPGPLTVEGEKGHQRRLTRLDLADWLTDPTDGHGLLTARVFANRFWYLFFGSGLAELLDDFGGQGSPPDHPELLDRLALEFVDSGWNVRHMLRLIVTSRTYQQSSVSSEQLRSADPRNRLFGRQDSWRLPAEMIRDNALSVSGLLVRKVGGASVRPYQPAGYYRHLNFPQRSYAHHADDRQWRRGLYVHWQRQFLHPMLKAFDAPSREECTARRPESNTPLAALALLNDPTFVEAAQAFAGRILSESSSARPEDRIQSAMRIAVSRAADREELAVLLALLKETHEESDLATWTVIARAILNLDETITRS